MRDLIHMVTRATSYSELKKIANIRMQPNLIDYLVNNQDRGINRKLTTSAAKQLYVIGMASRSLNNETHHTYNYVVKITTMLLRVKI